MAMMSMRGTITSRTRVSPKSAMLDMIRFSSSTAPSLRPSSPIFSGSGITSSAKRRGSAGEVRPRIRTTAIATGRSRNTVGTMTGRTTRSNVSAPSSASARAANAGSSTDAAANTPEPTGPAPCTSPSAETMTARTDSARAMPSATPVFTGSSTARATSQSRRPSTSVSDPRTERTPSEVSAAEHAARKPTETE
jgi:hypothetical protein